jgi:hypothetical protein
VAALAGCGGAAGTHVALPPVSANPQGVIAGYVAAINAHDLTTARALLTPTHAQLVEREPDGWFTNIVSVTALKINRPFNDPLDARQRHYRYAVGMGVTFDLKQHQVMSMPNGPTVWGYILVRNSRTQRWLIADEGTG